MRSRYFLLALILLLAACSTAQRGPAPTPAATRPPLPSPVLASRQPPNIPEVDARLRAVTEALAADPPVVNLLPLDDAGKEAAALALRDDRVRTAITTGSGDPLLTEVMVVRPTRTSDQPTSSPTGCGSGCTTVQLYTYPTNTTTTVLVDRAAQSVRAVTSLPDSQPEIPEHLAKLAVAIARATPEVQQQLQIVPPAEMATMEATKTALGGTSCDRSRHLCVAPVFRWGDRALWAVTDLVDLAVVGVEWTDLAASSGRRVTETSVQNAVVARLCDAPETLTWGDWTLSYLLTSSDGLEVRAAQFKGQPVADSLKIVDWHVRYPGANGQAAGFADAVGCPVFSQAAVVPFAPPVIEPITEGGKEIGVSISQEFRSELWPVPCNYSYTNRFAFYADGTWEMLGISKGRGCGTQGVYRPIFRIALAVEGQVTERWEGASWQRLTQEQWLLPEAQEARSPDGAQLRLGPPGNRWELRPDAGSRPDNAFVYLTRAKPEEGASDLPSIGDCCQEDYHQGPQQFIEPNPEPLEGAVTVLWYVPQMPNQERGACWADSVLNNGIFVPEVWPCSAGPRFVLVKEP